MNTAHMMNASGKHLDGKLILWIRLDYYFCNTLPVLLLMPVYE
jgi:hypothetical protein